MEEFLPLIPVILFVQILILFAMIYFTILLDKFLRNLKK